MVLVLLVYSLDFPTIVVNTWFQPLSILWIPFMNHHGLSVTCWSYVISVPSEMELSCAFQVRGGS